MPMPCDTVLLLYPKVKKKSKKKKLVKYAVGKKKC